MMLWTSTLGVIFAAFGSFVLSASSSSNSSQSSGQLVIADIYTLNAMGAMSTGLGSSRHSTPITLTSRRFDTLGEVSASLLDGVLTLTQRGEAYVGVVRPDELHQPQGCIDVIYPSHYDQVFMTTPPRSAVTTTVERMPVREHDILFMALPSGAKWPVDLGLMKQCLKEVVHLEDGYERWAAGIKDFLRDPKATVLLAKIGSNPESSSRICQAIGPAENPEPVEPLWAPSIPSDSPGSSIVGQLSQLQLEPRAVPAPMASSSSHPSYRPALSRPALKPKKAVFKSSQRPLGAAVPVDELSSAKRRRVAEGKQEAAPDACEWEEPVHKRLRKDH
jgi:hypothetical protein